MTSPIERPNLPDAATPKRRDPKHRVLRVVSSVSRWLTLLRDVTMAAIFRRDETDAFFVAFTIPSALGQMLGEGAVSRATAPVLAKKLKREGEAAAIAFYQRARGAVGAVLIVMTAAGIVLAEPLTDLLASGYRARSGEFSRTIHLTETLFPFLFLSGMTSLGAAALTVRRRVGFAIVAPMILNLAFLAAMLALPDVLDARGLDRAQALAVGALVGGALQVGVQVILLRRLGWGARALVDLRDPGVREVARRIAPLLLPVAVYCVQLIVSRRLLSDLDVGAQSWFSWAMRICEVTQAFFVAGAATTALASKAHDGPKSEAIGKECTADVRVALFVAVPASVLLAALASPIVVALYQRGEVDASSASQTARALVWQGGAMWAAAVTRHLVRAFYTLHDTRTPLVVSAIGVLAFVTLALGLRPEMGHVGISAAVAGASVVQTASLFVALRLRLPSLGIAGIAVSAARALLLGVLAGAGGLSAALVLTPGDDAGALARAVPGVVGVFVFVAAFVGLAWALHAPELRSLLDARARKRAAQR